MNILHINKFHHWRDGASIVYLRTAQLLESHGHQSYFFSMKDHDTLPCETDKYFLPAVDLNADGLSIVDQLYTAGRFLYSFEAKKLISRLLDEYSVDIAHIHNIYHHISPSILHELKKRKIPVVMTMHDYKMACGAYAMLSQGRHCEACRGGKYIMAIKNRCVKNSLAKSTLAALEMFLHHKVLDIYDKVDIFIAPSRFLKNKLAEMGFNKEIVHLPNFIDVRELELLDDSKKNDKRRADNSFVYIGRVSEEKGLRTLIDAAGLLSKSNENGGYKIKIIGDGPIKKELQDKVKSEHIGNIRFLGYMTGKELYQEVARSRVLILPSECYENNPLSVIEAFTLGKPVIGSRVAGIPELVRDNETGLTFESRNPDDLCTKMKYFIENSERAAYMGKNARILIDKELNAEKHYEQLMRIYEKAKLKNSLRFSAK